MPDSTRTDTYTCPPRQFYQRKGVRQIVQCNEKDRLGESTWPPGRNPDMTRAVSQHVARITNMAAQVWGVAELASLICASCYIPPSECSIAQPRLVNLARVNRLISDAALRQLWRDLPSLRPLLSLLPSDLVDLQFDAEWNPTTSPLPVSVTILRSKSPFSPPARL